jgi:hypothetical protein
MLVGSEFCFLVLCSCCALRIIEQNDNMIRNILQRGTGSSCDLGADHLPYLQVLFLAIIYIVMSQR